MGFLSWLAEWCRRYIPIVGEHIAYIVEQIECSIESLIDPIKSKLSIVFDWFLSIRSTVNDFVRDPEGFIKRHVGSWVKSLVDSVNNALDTFKRWAEPKIKNLVDFVSTAENWLINQLSKLSRFIYEKIKPFVKGYLDFVAWFKRSFSDFLRDPVSFIQRSVSPLLKSLEGSLREWIRSAYGWVENAKKFITKDLPEFISFANDMIDRLKNAILGVDDWIRERFFEAGLGLAKWFIYTLIDDLYHLEYDLETGEVIGSPKNPLTMIFIAWLEVEKPSIEYESVSNELEIGGKG